MWISLVVIFLSACSLWFLKVKKRFKNSPPGPFQWPLIGNLLQLRAKSPLVAVAMHEMAKTYGDIMMIKSGKDETVVLSSAAMVREFLGREELIGKETEGAGMDRNFGRNMGIIFGLGEIWKDIRRFTVRNLRDFGFGKSTKMEEFIQEELKDLIKSMKDSVRQTKDGVLHINGYFGISTVSVLWSLMMGERIAHDQPKFRRLLHVSEEWFKAAHFVSGVTLMFPILRHIFPGFSGRTLQDKCVHDLWEYFRGLVKEHRKRIDYKENPKSFVDLFLAKIDAEIENKHSSFTDEQLVSTIIDMFQAGSETSNSVLCFAILYLMLNPSCQRKAQDEIDRVVPAERFPILADRDKMIYMQALLLEVHRVGNIVPLIIPRKAVKDFSHLGYDFKKGTSFVQNNYAICNDSTFWGDTESFRPERFIGIDGKIDKILESHIIPFGYGKRVCPGESLANTTIFLYISTLMQQFSFKTAPGQSDLKPLRHHGFIDTPHAFDVLVEIRSLNQ